MNPLDPLPGLTAFRDEAEEVRCLVELLDESVNREEIDRLREIVTRARREAAQRIRDVRDLAEIVAAMEALRQRIWVYRIADAVPDSRTE